MNFVSEEPEQKEFKLARVRINPQDRKYIEQVALNCGSTDNNKKPSLKQLLEDIGTGRLEVIPAVQIEAQAKKLEERNSTLFELAVTMVCDLNGTLAVISKIVRDCGGDLHQTIAEVSNDKVIVIFGCDKGEKEIIERINQMTFGDVAAYNGFDKRKHFIERIDPKAMEAYRAMQTENRRINYIDTAIKDYLETKIVIHVEQSFYLQIEVKTKRGVFHDVMQTLANKKVSVLSTNQLIDYKKDVGYINLFAGINMSDYDKDFNGIDKLKREIESLDNVISVMRRRNGIFYQNSNPNTMII